MFHKPLIIFVTLIRLEARAHELQSAYLSGLQQQLSTSAAKPQVYNDSCHIRNENL